MNYLGRCNVIIREEPNWIEIVVVDRVGSDLPMPGDVEISVEVRSGKFNGQGFAWIDAKRLAAFVNQLEELDRTRNGEATIEGMSPEDFYLRVHSVNRRGHLAVAGVIATPVHDSVHGMYRHSIEFGFTFDPTQFPKVVAGFREIAMGKG